MSRKIGHFDTSGNAIITVDIAGELNAAQAVVSYSTIEYNDSPDYGGKIIHIDGWDTVNSVAIISGLPVKRVGDDLVNDPPEAPSYISCSKFPESCCYKCRPTRDNTCHCSGCSCNSCGCDERTYTFSVSAVIEANA